LCFRCVTPHFSQKRLPSYFRKWSRRGVCAQMHPHFSHLLQQITSQRLNEITARLHEKPSSNEYQLWSKFQTNRPCPGKVVCKWICTWSRTRHMTLNSCLHALNVEANAAYHTKILHDVYVTSWSKLCT
jgi:hypothetical protein